MLSGLAQCYRDIPGTATDDLDMASHSFLYTAKPSLKLLLPDPPSLPPTLPDNFLCGPTDVSLTQPTDGGLNDPTLKFLSGSLGGGLGSLFGPGLAASAMTDSMFSEASGGEEEEVDILGGEQDGVQTQVRYK